MKIPQFLYPIVSMLLFASCATAPSPASGTGTARARTNPRTNPMEAPHAELSLEDAVLLALSNNPDLEVQRFEPLVAGTFLAREQARYSPEIYGEISHRESRSSETARATGEQFDAEVEQTRLSAGVRREFATGTEAELSASHGADSSNRSPDQEEARLSLSLTQSLLRGRGREVNLIGIRRAELGLEISEEELRGFTEALVAEVETAYWRFWLANETIAITEQALEVAEQQLSDIQQRIEVGQLARNEDAPARAEVARRRQALIDARAELFRARMSLGTLISPELDPDAAPRMAATLPELPEPEGNVTPDNRIELALGYRPDLREARLRLEQRTLDTQLSRNGLLPRLDFFMDLAKTGFGPKTGDAWSDLSEDNYDVQAGLRFSRSLGERVENARDAETRFREDQAHAAVLNLERLIRTGIHLALNELDRAEQQVAASAETRRLQELTVASEVERFDVGAVTALQVAQAQRDLLNAMIEEQNAKVNARIALLELYRAEGSLLDRRGIGR
ncbi:MAG: TolC family protein [Verrucomicrobia bacterium]|nr:TolC family protein [Verrucomicrobiota bacterium]MCH8510378.1 TolC family protein [Kiritimatiellia bacterium]